MVLPFWPIPMPHRINSTFHRFLYLVLEIFIINFSSYFLFTEVIYEYKKNLIKKFSYVYLERKQFLENIPRCSPF